VANWRRQEREEGRRAPKPHSGGVPSRLDAAVLEVLRQLVLEDNDALLAYLEQVLVPKLLQVKPDAILVMDNLRPHHATQVRELLAQ
jgi:transposase